MPKSCVVPGCTNHNMMRNEKFSFYLFPDEAKQKDRYDRWLEAVNHRDKPDGTKWIPGKHTVICSAHFISGKPVKDALHPDYVPSIFGHPSDNIENASNNESLESRAKKIRIPSDPDIKNDKMCNIDKNESFNMTSGPPTIDKTASNAMSKQPGSMSSHPASSVTLHLPYTVAHNPMVASAVPGRTQTAQSSPIAQQSTTLQKTTPSATPGRIIPPQTYQSKYGELLNVIEDLGREIKPTYAGSKMAQERLKKGIMHARTLVRECLLEVDKNSRQ